MIYQVKITWQSGIRLVHSVICINKYYFTLKLTFDPKLQQNRSGKQKRMLLKIVHLVQVSFLPSGIILLQNAVGINLSTYSGIMHRKDNCRVEIRTM